MGSKYTQAQAEASKRYLDKHDQIRIRVPEGQKAEYMDRAAAAGKSLNQYIIDCIGKAGSKTEDNIYLIYKDSMDDAATIIGYIKGTPEEADKYCDEHNAKCNYEWEMLWWMLIEDCSVIQK